jgi:diguanylate cyclase (GGDEF)-like protein
MYVAKPGASADLATPQLSRAAAPASYTRLYRQHIGYVGLTMALLGAVAQPVAGLMSGAPLWKILAVFLGSAACVAVNAFAQVARGYRNLRTAGVVGTYLAVAIGLVYLNGGLFNTALDPLLWVFSFLGLVGLYGSNMLTALSTLFFVASVILGKLYAPAETFGATADQSWERVATICTWWTIAMFAASVCGRRMLRLARGAMETQEELRRACEREASAVAIAAGATELARAHRVARIGTWRQNLSTNTVVASAELLELLELDMRNAKAMRESLMRLVPAEFQPGMYAALARALAGPNPVEHEWRALRRDGELAWFWGELSVERDEAGQPVAVRGVCQDVTEHRTNAERVFRLAHHDPLTGLANRTLLAERVEDALARARRAGSKLAVLCLDLDGFKAVNDLHGHAVGDSLLREVASRLQRSVRDIDTVARLGGDEFVVLQIDPVQPRSARQMADRLVAILAEPCDLGIEDTRPMVTASIGVALFPDDGATVDELLRNADTALYRAKWSGKNGAAFFHPEMDRELRDRRALECDLRAALGREEMRLAWQPLSDAGAPAAILGFEVLLRWDHPARGAIPPDVFIPVAEACGAITSIGAWVLREACAEAAQWGNALNVAVNVSPVQLQTGSVFVAMVRQVIADTGIDPSRLILEVTEGVLIREPDRVLSALREMKAMGIQVALDDFGTGYSSLATLRAFPFDKLKIDRSFIAGLCENGEGQDSAIVRAVLGLARGLQLPVVAEGVETALQRDILAAVGCQELQGWLIGRPAPIEDFSSLTGRRQCAEVS